MTTHRPRLTQEKPTLDCVFKIVEKSMWLRAISTGQFAGSADDVRDGFIHLSRASQIAGTLTKHFSNTPDLLLVAFNPESLGAKLRFETSRGGELFPHFYGPLPTDLALWSQPIATKPDGTHDINQEMLQC